MTPMNYVGWNKKHLPFRHESRPHQNQLRTCLRQYHILLPPFFELQTWFEEHLHSLAAPILFRQKDVRVPPTRIEDPTPNILCTNDPPQ